MKNRMILSCFCGAVFTLISSVFELSAENHYFKHYTIEDGLCHQTIHCALQDKNGFMWFGTKAGLSRFDGHSFKNYLIDPGRIGALPTNDIKLLAEGKDGRIWTVHSGGLCVFDPLTDNFTPFSCKEFEITGSISRMDIDLQGNVWILNMNGIYIIDPEGSNNICFPSESYIIPTSICVTKSGRVWVAGRDGFVHSVDPQRGITLSYRVLSDEEIDKGASISAIKELENGDLIFTTFSLGMRLLSIRNGEVTTLFSHNDKGDPIIIHTVLQKGPGEFWIGSESGIFIYRIGTGFTENLTKSYEDYYSLSDNSVHVLYKDREDGLWVGTYFGGLSYLSRDNTLFEKYFPINSEGRRSGNVIRAIQQDNEGNLWVATEDGGLCFFNNDTGILRSVDDLYWNRQALPKNIQGILLKDDNHLWISTYDDGIFVLDIQAHRIIKNYGHTGSTDGLFSGTSTILKSEFGKVFVGTRAGLYLYTEKTDSFIRIQGTYSMVRCLYEDNEHNLWAGTLGDGCFKISIPEITTDSTLEKVEFESDLITGFFEDSHNNFWIMTEGLGLYKYDRVSKDASPLFPRKEYPGIIVYRVEEDAMGYLWISTSSGLIRYSSTLGITNRYSTLNGLPINQFNYNSSYQDKTGRIFMGTVKGLVAFYPERLMTGYDPLKVYFTGIDVGEESIDVLYKNKVTLREDQRTFSVNYAAPSFSISQNLWFRYKMEGLDDDWTIKYNPEKLSYTKLPPGKYKLLIQVSHNRNQWDGKASSLSLTIKPSVLKSKVAYGLYILLLLLAAIYLIMSLLNRFKNKEKEKMEKIKSEKEKESLQSMINFFTNITHEIRTPLTLIIGSLKRIKEGGINNTSNEKNLLVMEKNTQRLQDLVNQLLDFRKMESTAFHMNYSRLNLNLLIKDLHSRFLPMTQEKNATLTLDVPDEDYEITADKDALNKILSNLFSNAIKFCSKYASVSLEASGKEGSRIVRVLVNNDGERLPDEVGKDIFKPFFQYKSLNNSRLSTGTGLGLSLSKSLAELHNGNLYFNTREKELNSFILELPLEKNVHKDLQDPETKKMEDDRQFKPLSDKPTVLIVEDESDMRSFISEELSMDYDVIVAENGKVALSILEKHNVALIISDLMMPEMDGITLCKTVKNNIKFCHIPIIVLTAKVSQKAHLEALESNADAFVEKPFSTEHLLAQISNLISNRELIHSTFINSPYAHMSTVTSNPLDEEFMVKMNTYVMNNLYDTELSVENLAWQMNMSISTLFRKVKSITSLSPGDFIKLCRLKKAAELLSQGKMRINEVSEVVGFTSPSYFTACFMKQFGMTPSEFLKKNKN